VESAFDSPDETPEGLAPRELWIIVGAVLAIVAVILVRVF